MRTRDRSGSAAPSGPRTRDGGLAAGKRARTDAMVQRATSGAAARDGDDARATAARGTAGAGQPLPHLGAIQRSFGRHDVTGVRAHLGEGAAAASADLGALGYAVGDDVAFARSPDLHLAAHEAAHVVQQRAGVMLKDGLGDSGDIYERHADAVADRVVRGEPAEELLDSMTGGGAGRAVQRVDDEDTAARPPSRAERERAYAHAVEAAAIERMRGSYGDRGRVDLTPDGLRVEVRRGIRRARLAGGVIEVPPPAAGEAPSDGVVEEVVGFAEQRDGRLGQRAAEAAGGFRRDELDIGTTQLTEPVFWVSPAYTGELYHVAAALEADPRHRYVLVDDPVERDERGLAVRVDELERAARRRARERAIALLGADRLATGYGDGGVIAYEERRRFLPLVQTTAISGAAMTPGSDHHDPGARGRVRDRLLGEGDEATAGQEAARAFLARRGAGAPALVDPLAPKVLIWVRRRGDHDPARDASPQSLFQLATAAQARGMTPVFVGPPADEALPDGIDLTGHWRDPAFAGEGGLRAQLHMFDLLHREYGVVGQIGLKSGGMDGPALTGMPTISIGEPADRRMRRWDGVDGIHRVETRDYDATSADPARRELDVLAVGSIEADLDGWAAGAAQRRAAALRSVVARRAARDDQPETATAARRALAAMAAEPSMAQLEVIALAADVGDDELSAAAQPAATADFHELMDRGDYAAATAAAARPDPRTPGDDSDDDVASDYDPRLLPPRVPASPVPEVRHDTQVSVDPTGVTGIEVEVGVPTGEGQHVTTSFGYDVDVSTPYYHDDGYRIDGRLTWTGRFGGEAEYEQSHREIGASVHVGEVRTFVRRFATRTEAQAWYEGATSGFNLHSWTEFGVPGSADEALALATGESRSVARQAGAEAEVSQELPIGVEVGATFGVDDERELVVIRADAGHVRLRVRTRTTARAGGTLGAGGFGMGLSGSRGVIAGREVEFDVADGSPGRAALTHALETRTLPEGESGDGWRQTEVTAGTTRGSGQSFEMAGVDVRFEQSVDDETVTAADGSQRRRITGRSAESASMLPDWLADGTMLEAGSQSTEMVSASGSGATITYVVDGTDARDSAIMLANVSGDASRLPAATGDDAGQWQVTTVLTEAQLVGFLRSCHSGAVRRHAHHLGTAADALDTLIAAVRAAGSRDDARAAAVAFVSETRDRGTAVIRAAIGGTITADVSLQGSRAFEGAAGRERVRGQAAALRGRLAAGEDAGAIAHEALVLARAQRERVDTIGDTDRHRELPPAMRAREAALARELLTELEGLAAEARSARAAHPAAQDAEGSDGGDGAARDPDRLRAAYRHDLERMSRLHEQAQLAYRAVRSERDVHEGTAAVHFSATARERCHHQVSYEEADRLWHEARERWTDADRQRVAIEEQQADLDVDGALSVNAEARLESIRRKAWRAHDGYAASLRAFVALGHIYRDVRALLADERRAYFGATAFTPPEEPPEAP
jgi:hypothetical protein